MLMYLIIEAKQDPKRSRRTILTYDHFREIQRFNEWLDRLEYPIVPGIPKNMPYSEPPKTLKFYDLCRKEGILEKFWPEGTSEECRYNPYLCPGVAPLIMPRCEREAYPLDFIYETSFSGYNFKRFRTDDDIV